MDINFGEIINSKNFNRLMLAVAVGLFVWWRFEPDNYYILVGLITAAVYSVITIVLIFKSWIIKTLDERKTQKELINDEKEQRKQIAQRAKEQATRMFDSLSFEQIRILCYVLTFGKKDQFNPNMFIFHHNDPGFETHSKFISSAVNITSFQTEEYSFSSLVVRKKEHHYDKVIFDPYLLELVEHYKKQNEI